MTKSWLGRECLRLLGRRDNHATGLASELLWLSGRAMNNLLQDLGFALRQLRRSPAFAFTGITILTLAIAADVMVFGVLQALILRPLELTQPDRVMQLARTSQVYPVFSYPEVRDVRDNNTVFCSVAAYTMLTLGLEVDKVSRVGWGYEVSGQYFELTGIQPSLGRLLQPADDQPGAAQVAVLSWAAWKGSFGADPNIVGKKVRIDKQPYTIVGVAPDSAAILLAVRCAVFLPAS
jgi:MacB-like periplasmic core domain